MPQLYDLSGLLEDFSLCTYEQGFFIYPPTLALDRVSIDSNKSTDLYLLSYRSLLYYYLPAVEPDPTLLRWLLGPNYQFLIDTGDYGPVLSYEGAEEFGPSTFVGRLASLYRLEESSMEIKPRSELILAKDYKLHEFMSIIDEFSMY